jgi:cell division inhibitor SulA
MNQQEIQAASQKSCGVLRNLGPEVQWLESFVTEDKMYCVYIAPDEKLVQEHASQSGFPAHRVAPVKAIIGPTNAEG